jgi:alpha-L-rhamnosidase
MKKPLPIAALFSLCFIALVSCTQKPEIKDPGGFLENSQAQWLTDGRELPGSDSLFYLDRPAPLFRKEFLARKKIAFARLSITAAGYYKASLNGADIGKNELDPAWTDYSKRIYYTDYEVTSLLEQGDNCLAVSLGNGFYNPLPLRMWGHRNLRNDTHVGKPAFLARLFIQYKDGSTEEIVSDESWKYSYGPILKNSVYLGVTYDARREIPDWNMPGFDNRGWKPARIGKAPGGKLDRAFFPPVQIAREIEPVGISSPEPGIFVVDMGENFTGTFRINMKGATGDTLVFRFGERIYEDGRLNPMTSVVGQIKRKGMGGPGAPDIAWQTHSYIFGGESRVSYKPDFTYHAYRYMEIAGLRYQPQISDIRGLSIHTLVEDQGSFSCSSELLNSIQQATERTFLANLVSVQSDCPAREKFGYGGDLNATSESYIYNFDMQDIYRKTLYDWLDAMKDSSFVDTAPFVGIAYCGISWESAYLITQYTLYLYYGDLDIVSEFYEHNVEWMEKVARIHPEGLVERGLSDHESLEPVPVQLTGTAHYLQCARIMKTFAAVMGDDKNISKYQALEQRLKDLLKAEFWDQAVEERINRQTLFSTLLYHGIVPEDQIEAARDSLLKAVKNGPSSHFHTGIFGTKYILETLSEYASPDAVYEVVHSRVFPGWGHMIDRGATTLWETWQESDNTYSNNHPMFGSVTEWFYRWLGGIRPDPENPGFHSFLLAPSTPAGLAFVNCTHDSPMGKIASHWERLPSGLIRYQMTVPPGCMAKVILPPGPYQSIEISGKSGPVEPQEIQGLQTGHFQLMEGEYLISTLPGGTGVSGL